MLERAVLPDLAERAGVRGGDRQPHAAHLGRERVPRGRAARPPARGARRRRQPDDRVPGQRHRGHQGAPHGSKAGDPRRGGGPPRRRGGRGARRARPPRVLRRRRADGGRGRVACSWPAARPSPWPSRSPAVSSRPRIVAIPGASEWFRGGIVAYASEVKADLLGVPPGPGRRPRRPRWPWPPACAGPSGADIGLSTTGVAGPTEQDGQPRARSGSAWRWGTRWTRSSSASPATASGSAR